MNILVAGSRGQLGSELKRVSGLTGSHHYYFYDLPELDITNAAQVEEICRLHSIQAIVNCAAYTAVDKAESDSASAFLVNRDGPAVLARCAKDRNALLVHISTDYVFNGESNAPYRESDRVSPASVYGLSKWEGEEAVRRIGPSHLIIRTSWLYSPYGSNFVKTMLRLGAEKSSLTVVFDQIGTPTCAADLASAIASILDRCDLSHCYGETYHYSNEGVCSWYDFAEAIMELAGLSCRVLPVESSEYPTLARRPGFSVLNKSAIKKSWGVEIPYWRRSLATMLREMQREAT
ncbi:dTDP-4-dehydrorhamnose reductase [Chlorobium sp. KB01]|uniref:dTDP-4-dehydrorhamnose reductase n=1 Tax=Chlorobium sp. KB01 TaxID=1917528 RepID=UPI0009789805|nr:dTDP-4-dehydrorhamnose reductase [Chlorobium sp. KB01]